MKLHRSNLLTSIGASALLAALACTSSARADTVILRNGSRIEGQITDDRAGSGKVIVSVADGGTIRILAREVESIVSGQPAPAPAESDAAKAEASLVGQVVRAVYAEGRDITGTGAFVGVLSAESNAREVVLEIPGAGKMRLERSSGLVVEKSDARIAAPSAPDAASAERSIKTTHVAHLRNGRKILGNLVPTPENQAIKMTVGSQGIVWIERKELADPGIKEEENTIQLGEPAPPAVEPAKPVVPDEVREAIKRELRAEILRELLDGLIEEKLEAAVDRERVLEFTEDAGASRRESRLETAAIEDSVRELTRWRSRNRVRAENHLKAAGAAALPHVARIADHPFDLARRAVQRIVRDVGALEGAPIAIEALDDTDAHVRALAGEALAAVLPTTAIRYNASGSETARLEAQERYRALWTEVTRGTLRNAILAGIAAE